MDRIPAERFTVGEYIRDELTYLGLTTRDCAERMGGGVSVDVHQLSLDLLIAMEQEPIGHPSKAMRLDIETAEGLERALGPSAGMWMRLDETYHSLSDPSLRRV